MHLFLGCIPRSIKSNEPTRDICRDGDQARTVFDEWFTRCHRMLHFVAYRLLGGSERAELAVRNCRLTASCKPPHFEHEGAFRSWLLRVLINEALAIVRPGRSEKRSKDFREETS